MDWCIEVTSTVELHVLLINVLTEQGGEIGSTDVLGQIQQSSEDPETPDDVTEHLRHKRQFG